MNSTPLPIRVVIWLWLLAAVVVSHFEWLRPILGPAVQGILFALTALVLLAYNKISRVRNWVDSLDLRALVMLHVTRFVGFYFLILYQRGELPYAFAVPGGWGDNLVAAGALLVCLVPMSDAARRRAITIWNVVGLADILMVVATAARIALNEPEQLRLLVQLPLGLLPTFLVPLIIATHIIIFIRLRKQALPTAAA